MPLCIFTARHFWVPSGGDSRLRSAGIGVAAAGIGRPADCGEVARGTRVRGVGGEAGCVLTGGGASQTLRGAVGLAGGCGGEGRQKRAGAVATRRRWEGWESGDGGR